jgi:pimeloyl-ACP methyl ester carboxylesterase
MPTIRANGLDIGYDVHGAGPPLVLLHGAGSSGREDWAAQVPAFSKGFHVFLPDARGHASTRWNARDGFSYEVLVDDLGAFVDALGLDSFHLAGFSMGGLTALRFASRHPPRIRTLIVAGVSAQREPRARLVAALMDPDRRPPTGPLSEAALARRHDAVQGEGAWRDLFRAISAEVATQPLPEPREIHRADMPALVAIGDRDPFVPVDQAWALSRQLGDGRLLVLPECGHELMVRRPGLFNEAAGLFYRMTEPIARRRAEGGRGDAPRSEGRHDVPRSEGREDARPGGQP